MLRVEFGSRDWVALEDGALGTDLADIEWSFCEEFTDPPGHLRRGAATTIGWHVRIGAGRLEVGDGPVDDAAFKLVIAYKTALYLARLHLADPEQAEELARAFRDGRIRIEGEGSAGPSFFTDLGLHDRMAEVTR